MPIDEGLSLQILYVAGAICLVAMVCVVLGFAFKLTWGAMQTASSTLVRVRAVAICLVILLMLVFGFMGLVTETTPPRM